MYAFRHFAAAYGHLAVIKRLLELGADPLKVNESGEMPLDLAKMKVGFGAICSKPLPE